MRHFLQNVTVVLIALALAFVSFGHRIALAKPIDLTAYAMPDGTLPQLCLDGTDAGKSMADKRPCPACVIAAAVCLPAAMSLPVVQLPSAQANWPVASQPIAQAHQPRAPPARGPPTFLI